MKLSAALDTSTRKTAICVVNSRDGSVKFETTVATDPAIIFAAPAPYRARLDRVGHEAASVSPWLHRELNAMGLSMVLLETRHSAAALKGQRNNTDKNDARGLLHGPPGCASKDSRPALCRVCFGRHCRMIAV